MSWTYFDSGPRSGKLKTAGIIALILVGSVGMTLIIVYANNNNAFAPTSRMNTVEFTVNNSILVFGDSLAPGLTVNITHLYYAMLFADYTRLHQYLSEGNLTNVMNSVVSEKIVLISNASKDKYPSTWKETFSDKLSGIEFALAFVAEWSNGTIGHYNIVIVNGLPSLNQIKHMLAENDSVYTMIFGGVHYNSTLLGFDWASFNMNGYAPHWNLTWY